jgi:hypothetical protein
VETYCNAAAQCCGGVGLSASTCKQGLTSANPIGSFNYMLTSPNVAFDLTKWNACLATLQAAAGNCDLLIMLQQPGSDCQMGTIPPGGTCTAAPQDCSAPPGSIAECKSQVCTYSSRGKLGDACQKSCGQQFSDCLPSIATSGAHCYHEDGLYCDPGTLQCAAVKPVGGTGCNTVPKYACASGAYCNNQQCAAQKAIGSVCTTDPECLAGYCNGSACAGEKSDGAACLLHAECASEYCHPNTQVCTSPSSEFWLGMCAP